MSNPDQFTTDNNKLFNILKNESESIKKIAMTPDKLYVTFKTSGEICISLRKNGVFLPGAKEFIKSFVGFDGNPDGTIQNCQRLSLLELRDKLNPHN